MFNILNMGVDCLDLDPFVDDIDVTRREPSCLIQRLHFKEIRSDVQVLRNGLVTRDQNIQYRGRRTSSVTLLNAAHAIPSRLSTKSSASIRSIAGGSRILRLRARPVFPFKLPLGIGWPLGVGGLIVCVMNDECREDFVSERLAHACWTLGSWKFSDS